MSGKRKQERVLPRRDVRHVGRQLQSQCVVCNLISILRQQLRGGPCIVNTADLRISVGGADLYTYPDVSVVCGKPELLDSLQDTLLNPILIAEVLSPSTEAYDRGLKFQRYRSVPSLRYYLLVAQDRMQLEVFTRDGEQWILTSASEPEQRLWLEAIRCEIRMSDLYEKVLLEQ